MESTIRDATKMIRKGKYMSLEQVFAQLTETGIRNILGISGKRAKVLRRHPEKWKLNEIFQLTTVLEVEADKLFNIIYSDYKKIQIK